MDVEGAEPLAEVRRAAIREVKARLFQLGEGAEVSRRHMLAMDRELGWARDALEVERVAAATARAARRPALLAKLRATGARGRGQAGLECARRAECGQPHGATRLARVRFVFRNAVQMIC